MTEYRSDTPEDAARWLERKTAEERARDDEAIERTHNAFADKLEEHRKQFPPGGKG